MSAYISLWNPTGTGWEDVPQLVEKLARGETVIHRYGVGNRTSMEPGSTLYVWETGAHAGMRARAVSLVEPYRGPRLERDDERTHMEVLARFLEIRDPGEPPFLSRRLLESDPVASQQHWTFRGGGIELKPTVEKRVADLWAGVLEYLADGLGPADQLTALEGQTIERLSRHRRRERSLRPAKLAEARRAGGGRLVCERCTGDLTARYGTADERVAEVHHLRPLAEEDGPRETTLADLAVVCANCHRYIHSRIPLYRLGECRTAIEAR